MQLGPGSIDSTTDPAATSDPPSARANAGISDAALMARLAKGDTGALGELVLRHQRRVRSVAYRVLGRWDAADDVCQDAFVRVYRAAGEYRPQAAFGTWLYRIVVNLCLDRAKRPHLAALPEQEDQPGGGPRADADLLRGERLAAVRRAVAALPERQRIAVVLHRYEGLSHGQIAAGTGWSESAVESLLVRAYAQLRLDLRDWNDG